MFNMLKYYNKNQLKYTKDKNKHSEFFMILDVYIQILTKLKELNKKPERHPCILITFLLARKFKNYEVFFLN